MIKNVFKTHLIKSEQYFVSRSYMYYPANIRSILCAWSMPIFFHFINKVIRYLHLYFFDCSFKLEIIYYYFFQNEWSINISSKTKHFLCNAWYVWKKDENSIYYHDISVLFKLSALKMADLKIKHIFMLFIFLLLYLFFWFEVLDITHARSIKIASTASLTSVRKPVWSDTCNLEKRAENYIQKYTYFKISTFYWVTT